MNEKHLNLLVHRIGTFHKRLAGLIIREYRTFNARFRWCKDPVYFHDRLKGSYKPIQEGAVWGKTWESGWFHLTARVPKEWRGKQVVAQLCFSGEGLVFTPDGVPLQGVTNGSVFDHMYSRDIVPLYKSARGGEAVDLWVETACNGLFGVNRPGDPAENDPKRYGHYEGKVNKIRLAVMDEELWQLRMDVSVLQGQLKTHPQNATRHSRILIALNKAIDAFADNPDNAAKCRAILRPELRQPAHSSANSVTAVGHAHIDTGWLWPVRESIRKSARTFSSQLRLIERYPGYVFGESQPQLYAFVKEHYPKLYAKIRRAVKEGSWECQGGMWVEADCNIISGESMVRQFVHGKNFFRDEFGVDVRNLWIPDVFGYSASMPQIMKKAGCDFFVTQKISWSQFNRFPHNTFRWRGLDGSEVITHFPPEDNYNSNLQAEQMHQGVEKFQERGFIDGYLSLFGVGDGGGGPHEEHIESGLRQRNLEGAPKVKFGKAEDYLDTLTPHWDELSVWNGELYLELHRGTLTTQSRTKRGNRLLENRLRQTEYLWSCLPLARYPQAQLDRIWKTLLINQFHDIIPGSSITMVYETTEKQHKDCLAECDQLIAQAGESLLAPDANSVTLVNCLSYKCARPVELPANWGRSGAVDEKGAIVPVQMENGKAVAAVTVPAHGTVTLKKSGKPATNKTMEGLVLENELVRYEFNPDGTLKRAFDKEAGCAVLEGKGNLLSLYEDRPNQWDAWDIDIFYENQVLETARSISVTRIPGSAVRQGLRFELAVGKSKIEQYAYLAANSKRIDFQTRVDWKEKHHMLRVSFPVAIHTDKANFDIQYGHVERATHRNTSWDLAKFEVAAHRYVDLSNRDYGVALLNDCKYGHKILENVLDLNLLRSPSEPDPDADQGQHTFSYSLLPHTGTLIESNVMAEAAALNVPVMVFNKLRARKAVTACRIEGRGVSLEVVKKAEKEKCLIVRLVETDGRQSSCRLYTGRKATLVETNLMEWTDGKAVRCNGSVKLTLKPFEIRTYKVKG
jgi:alpha-mannosidase